MILALRDEAVRRGSLRLRVAAAWYAAEHALRVGRVGDAESSARLALELVDEGLNTFTGGAIEVLVRALAERGAFDEARELLRCLRAGRRVRACCPGRSASATPARGSRWPKGTSSWHTPKRSRRARCARPRAAEPSLAPWRSTAALALAHLGRRDEAAALAEAELALAMRFGAPLPIAGAFHARAVAEPDPPRASRSASARWRRSPRCRKPRVGAAAAGARQRARVPRPPRRSARRAAAGAGRRGRGGRGAALPSARAASSWRLGCGRGMRRSEGTAALTPRQRQICELAAVGKGNRAIAQELFLSVKTVETHWPRGTEARRHDSRGAGGGAARRPRRAAWTSRIGLRARPAERLASRRCGWWWRREAAMARCRSGAARVNLVATVRRTRLS